MPVPILYPSKFFNHSSPDKEDEAQRRRWTFYEVVKVANRKKLLILLGLSRRDTVGRAVMKRHKPHQTPQKFPTGQHTRR
jgi:hypothetical protein